MRVTDRPTGPLRPNQQRVLDALARADGLRRSDLVRQLGLPKATIAGLVDDLIARGQVIESTPQPGSGAGRPARSLTLAGPTPAIGALVWSTGLLRVAVVTLAGAVRAERTVSMTPQDDIDGLLDPALALLAEVAAQAGTPVEALSAVALGVPAPFRRGVGMPAPLGPASGTVHGRRSQYVPWLRDDPAGVLSSRTGVPALVENDANLGALGEHRFGAGRDADSMVYIKLGNFTMGAGLIINGQLHRGVTGYAGELAHVQVTEGGMLCVCGGRGCLINEVGQGLLRLVQPAYAHPVTFDAILDLAIQGDPGSQRILRDLGRSIGRPLADLCSWLNPAAIVVDGTVGPAGGYIIEGLNETISRYAAPSTTEAVRLLPGALGAHADLLGAVALVHSEHPH